MPDFRTGLDYDLSPAAQAVFDAGDIGFAHHRVMIAAAALRASALILQEAYANEGYAGHPDDLLLDIAAELEGQ